VWRILASRHTVGTIVVTILMTLITAIVVLNWWLTRSIRTLDLGFIIMIGFLMQEILRPGRRAEKWAMALAWWIPRKYRGTIVGYSGRLPRDARKGLWRVANTYPSAMAVGNCHRDVSPCCYDSHCVADFESSEVVLNAVVVL
jgi:hypothetical protein